MVTRREALLVFAGRRKPLKSLFEGSVSVLGRLRLAGGGKSLVLGMMILWTVSPSAFAQQDILGAFQQLRAKYAQDLEALAVWCQSQGLEAEGQRTRAWSAPRDTSKLYVVKLPEEIGPPKPPSEAKPEQVEWHNRFWRLRREQAGALWDLARRAVRSHRGSLAVELLLAAAREDPDHEGVRRVLGYQAYQGAWRTEYEVRKLRAGQVWHEKFGWLPKSYLARYEKGQRFYQGRWVSAEEDARLRADIHRGWDIETEHYLIRTNHSIEAGVALGVKLERLYRVWRELFVRYYATEAQMTEWFDLQARTQASRLPRHKVVYFRNQEEYRAALREAIPQIDKTIGLYFGPTNRCYFFAGDEFEDRTLLHEATHQLFYETRPVSPEAGRTANFWIIEGVAMLMETLREEKEALVLGGFEDDRIVAARYRLLEENFYVPLSEFCTYGMEKLQSDPRIATLYSQAAGLTHFLVFYDRGRYRDALIAYLTAIYSGRDNPGTLAQLTQTPYGELDRQYRAYMEASLQPTKPPQP